MPFVAAVLCLAAIAIKLDDGGKVFFVQERTGHKGKLFKMIKIRTMTDKMLVEDKTEAARTVDNDARITRVGKVIRISRIDELPQIFNILMGQMSWIGPRPNAVSLSAWYRAEFSQYDLRYVVPPGITGWAQVNQGHVSTVNEEREKVAYDLFYAKNVSFALDLLIVFKTFGVVFSGRGAK